MVASYIHLIIWTPCPMPLCSGKPSFPLSHIDFSYPNSKDIHALPLPLWALVFWQGVSFLERHSASVFCRGVVWHEIWHEKSFFSISGNISTELVHKTREKWTLCKLQKQEFGSVMVAGDIHLNVQTPAPRSLGSGKQPLPLSQLEFPYNGGK